MNRQLDQLFTIMAGGTIPYNFYNISLANLVVSQSGTANMTIPVNFLGTSVDFYINVVNMVQNQMFLSNISQGGVFSVSLPGTSTFDLSNMFSGPFPQIYIQDQACTTRPYSAMVPISTNTTFLGLYQPNLSYVYQINSSTLGWVFIDTAFNMTVMQCPLNVTLANCQTTSILYYNESNTTSLIFALYSGAGYEEIIDPDLTSDFDEIIDEGYGATNNTMNESSRNFTYYSLIAN